MSFRKISIAAVAALLLAPAGAVRLRAQEASQSPWSVYQRFQGSSSDYGQVLKLDTGLTYRLTNRVSVGAGVPYYVVRNTTADVRNFSNGIGNAYVNLGASVAVSPVRYLTSLKVGAPTGDQDQGFSTGQVTVDWNNYFSVTADRLMPFANIGLANTVSDTAFFTRPFSSLGLVGQLQGGATYTLFRLMTVSASAYAIVPSGEQTVVTRVRRPTDSENPRGGRPFDIVETEVVGDADLARDHGFSAWSSWYPTANVDFYAGYTRSVRYDLDSVFFGIGWNFRWD